MNIPLNTAHCGPLQTETWVSAAEAEKLGSPASRISGGVNILCVVHILNFYHTLYSCLHWCSQWSVCPYIWDCLWIRFWWSVLIASEELDLAHVYLSDSWPAANINSKYGINSKTENLHLLTKSPVEPGHYLRFNLSLSDVSFVEPVLPGWWWHTLIFLGRINLEISAPSTNLTFTLWHGVTRRTQVNIL